MYLSKFLHDASYLSFQNGVCSYIFPIRYKRTLNRVERTYICSRIQLNELESKRDTGLASQQNSIAPHSIFLHTNPTWCEVVEFVDSFRLKRAHDATLLTLQEMFIVSWNTATLLSGRDNWQWKFISVMYVSSDRVSFNDFISRKRTEWNNGSKQYSLRNLFKQGSLDCFHVSHSGHEVMNSTFLIFTTSERCVFYRPISVRARNRMATHKYKGFWTNQYQNMLPKPVIVDSIEMLGSS